MLDTILSALLPMVVTFLLGLVAAWRHDFGSKDASTLNRMVLQYAVPLALFAGTVMTSRKALGQDLPLALTLCVGIIGFYCVAFLFSRMIGAATAFFKVAYAVIISRELKSFPMLKCSSDLWVCAPRSFETAISTSPKLSVSFRLPKMCEFARSL